MLLEWDRLILDSGYIDLVPFTPVRTSLYPTFCFSPRSCVCRNVVLNLRWILVTLPSVTLHNSSPNTLPRLEVKSFEWNWRPTSYLPSLSGPSFDLSRVTPSDHQTWTHLGYPCPSSLSKFQIKLQFQISERLSILHPFTLFYLSSCRGSNDELTDRPSLPWKRRYPFRNLSFVLVNIPRTLWLQLTF